MIKFVYFDVGGVVIKDFSGTTKWDELVASMGISADKRQEFDEIFAKYEPEVCNGLDVEKIVPLLKEKLNLKLSNSYLLLPNFVNRFEKNELIWPVLKKIRASYQVGLLTNMYPGMLNSIYKKHLMPDIEWDTIIDSSVEKVRKPQIEIFQLAEKRCGFKGQEILFVENGKLHVEAANSFGWQTMLYNPQNIEESNKRLTEKVHL